MEIFVRILLDFISNFYCFLFIKLYINKKMSFPLTKADIFFLIACIFYSIPKHIPYNILLWTLIEFIYIFFTFNKKATVAVKNFFILIIAEFIGTSIISAIHSIIFFDFFLFIENETYLSYKKLICEAFLYVSLQIYINNQTLKSINMKKSYFFNSLIYIIIFSLSYLTVYLSQDKYAHSIMLPIIISTFFLIVALCLILYQKFIDLTRERIALAEQAYRDNLIKDYSLSIGSSLKEVHSIRHDMKNKLIIIQKYAQEKRYEDINALTENMIGKLNDSKIIDSGIHIVSAILNTKYADATSQNIYFDCKASLPFLSISDNDIITILGNLLDNAITAASKCCNAYIKLQIKQIDNCIVIQCCNNYIDTIKKRGDQFISLKEDDGMLHGIGIENIRKTVDKLGGISSFTYTDKDFYVELKIPNFQ